jgi:molybdate transport system substrate-binding protein
MKPKTLVRWLLSTLGVATLLIAGTASAADVHVMISAGFFGVYSELGAAFERASGHKVLISYELGAALMNKVNSDAPLDIVTHYPDAVDDLAKKGKVLPGTRAVFARAGIGVAVKAGAPKPDIGSTEAFKRAMLAAKSVAYSDSASGVYVGTELFKRLGVADEMKDKAKMIPAEPVAGVVARGEAELGFQQISELLPIPGADLVGPLPAEVQKITIFSAGTTTNAKQSDAGKALIAFLASSAAAPTLTKAGLEPIAPSGM